MAINFFPTTVFVLRNHGADHEEFPWKVCYPDLSGSLCKHEYLDVLVQLHPNVERVQRKSGRQVYILRD